MPLLECRSWRHVPCNSPFRLAARALGQPLRRPDGGLEQKCLRRRRPPIGHASRQPEPPPLAEGEAVARPGMRRALERNVVTQLLDALPGAVFRRLASARRVTSRPVLSFLLRYPKIQYFAF